MRRSILLADDSATIRRVVELTFSDTDFHVETVGCGAEALSKLEDLRPDVVLVDVVMPEPTGYEICRRIKSSDRPVPVLLLAGTFEAFDHEEARACGADGCLLKPFESRTLLERVTSLLANRDAVTSSAIEPLEVAPAVEEAVEAGVGEPVDAIPSGTGAGGRDDASENSLDVVVEELPCALEPEAIDAIARAVVHRLSEDVVREIAREVVPRVAEAVVRQRIRELEDGDS
jgi:CheY-like chemotaxis protein